MNITASEKVHPKKMAFVMAVVFSLGMARGTFHKTYIRAWRTHRRLTLEQLASRLDMTESHLSMLERGLRGYTQETLEAVAEALQTDAASLLIRDPSDPDGIWSIWDQAGQGERRQIVELAKVLRRTGR